MKSIILNYHNIVDSTKDLHLYDVFLDNFKQQVVFLRDTLPTGRQAQYATPCLPAGRRDTETVLTFDDGYKSWANEVLDVLKANDIKAYFFVCIEYLKNGQISKEDILKLKENGMIIGSHGMTHGFLTEMLHKERVKELKDSKNMLEEILGEEVKYFSIPRGVHNRAVVEAAKMVGYKNVFTSEVGINRVRGFAGSRVRELGGNNFLLKRIAIKRDTTLNSFKDILNGKNIKKMVLKQKIKDIGKGFVGIDFYNKIRAILVKNVE